GELPEEIAYHDLSPAGQSAADQWRSGGEAARPGWTDAGVKPIPLPVPPRPRAGDNAFVEGTLVRHPTYGTGRVTEVSGQGAMRRVKVRFSAAGQKSFPRANSALEVVR